MNSMKSTTAIGLAVAALLQSAAWSQSEPPLKPANAQTRLDVTPSGTPIVNIATPRADGTSYNVFDRLNVRREGLIFNNSATLGPSTIGGQILANPNLIRTGAPAKLIINEVIGGTRSDLGGAMEVFGSPAGLIIANAAGITCNGCGFINIPRVTLATGKVSFGASGAFTGFDVQGGDVLIEGNGLLAGNVDFFDIVTASAKVNASLYARDLSIAAGRGAYDDAARALRGRATAEGGQRLAIDSSILGGMYANRIRLIGTESGVGINLAGTVAALEGALEIDNRGDIRVAKAVASADATLSSTAGTVSVSDQLYAGGSARIAGAGIEIAGLAAASGSLDLRASGDIALSTASLYAGLGEQGLLDRVGNLTIAAGGSIDAPGAALGATGKLGLTAEAIRLGRESELAARDIDLGAQRGFSALGRIEAQGGLSLSGRNVDLGGTAIANGNLSIASDTVAISGAVIGLGSIEIGANAASSSATAQIQSNGRISLSAGAFGHDGRIAAGGPISLGVAGQLDNRGSIVSAREVDIAARYFAQSGAITANGTIRAEIGEHGAIGGTLASGGSLLISAGSLELSGLSRGADAISISARRSIGVANAASLVSDGAIGVSTLGDISTQGLLSSLGNASLFAGSQLLLGGTILSAGSISGTARTVASTTTLVGDGGIRLVATDGALALGGTASTASTLKLESTGLLSVSGLALADGAVTIGSEALSITGQLSGKRDVNVSATELAGIWRQGAIEAVGSVRIATGSLQNDGRILSGSGLELRAERAATLSGLVQSAGALALTASEIKLGGRILALDGLALSAGRLSANQDSSTYGGASAALMVDGPAALAGDLTTNGDLTIRIGDSLTASGRIAAMGDARIGAGGNLALGGVVESGHSLSLQSGTVAIDGQLNVLGQLDASSASTFATASSSSLRANGALSLNGGDVNLSGALASAVDLSVKASSIDIAGRLESGRSISIDAIGAARLEVGSTLLADNALSVSAGRDFQGHGRIGANGDISLSAGDALTLDGRLDGGAATSLSGRAASLVGEIAIDGALDVKSADTLIVGGNISALGTASLTATDIRIDATGSIAIDKTLSIAAANSFANAGSVLTNGGLALRHRGNASNTGSIFTGGDYIVSTESDFASSGKLTVAGRLSVTARDVAISGGLAGVSGLALTGRKLDLLAGSDLGSGTSVALRASDSIFLGGALTSVGDASVKAGADLSIEGAVTAGGMASFEAGSALIGNGTVSSAGPLSFLADRISIGGTAVSGAALSIKSATSLLTGGLLSSGGVLKLDSLSATIGGVIVSDASVAIRGRSLDVSGSISARDALRLDSIERVKLTTWSALNAGGEAIVSGAAIDAAGTILANGDAKLVGADVSLGSMVSALGVLRIDAHNRLEVGAASKLLSGSDLTLDGKGVVTLAGTAASGGDVRVSTGTSLVNSGSLSADRSLVISGHSLDLGGALYSGGATSIDSNGALLIGGRLTSLGDIAARAVDVDARTGAIVETNSALTFDVAHSFNNLGRIASLGSVKLSAGNLTNAGSISANGLVQLTGREVLVHSGTLAAGGAIALDGAETRIDGAIEGADAILIAADDMMLSHAAKVSGSGRVQLAALGYVSNGATIEALGPVTVSAAGSLDQSGGIRTNADLILAGDTVRNSAALLEAGGSLNIRAGDIASSGALRADGDLTLRADTGQISLSAPASAGAALSAFAQTALSVSNEAVAGGRITLDASKIHITGTAYAAQGLEARAGIALAVAANGVLASGGALAVTGNAFNNDGVVSSDGPATISLGGSLANNGSIFSAGNLGIAAEGIVAGGTIQSMLSASLDARSGAIALGDASSIAAARDLALRSDGAIDAKGKVFAGGRATISAGGALSLGGVAESVGAIEIRAASVALDGHLATGNALSVSTPGQLIISNKLLAAGTISLGFQDGSFGAQSRILSDGGIALNGGNVLTAGKIETAEAISIRANTLGLGGSLSSGAGLAVTASGAIAQAGTIETDGRLDISGADISFDGSAVALGGVSVAANALSVLQGARWQSGGDFMLSSTAATSLSGELFGAAAIGVSAGTTLTQSGLVRAAGTLDLRAGQALVHGGRSEAGASLSISGDTLAIDGAVTANGALSLKSLAGQASISGTASGGAAVNAIFGSDAAIGGRLISGGTLDARGAGAIAVTGIVSAERTALLSASRQLDLTGTIASRGPLDLDAGTLRSAGLIESAGSATLQAGSLELAGSILAGDALTLSSRAESASLTGSIGARSLSASIRGGDLVTSGAASIDVLGRATLVSDHSVSIGGRFAAGGDVQVEAKGGRIGFDQASRFSTNGLIDFRASAAFENASTLNAAGPVSIAAQTVRTGGLASNGSIDIASSGGLTVDGNMSALGDIRLGSNSGTLSVESGYLVASNGKFTATGGGLANRGEIAVAGPIEFRASGAFSNGGSILTSAGNIRLDAADATIDGELFANGALAIGTSNLAIGGLVGADADISIGAQALNITAAGLVQSNAGIAIDARRSAVDGSIQAQRSVSVRGQELITGSGSTIEGGPIVLTASEITHSGRIAANGALTLAAARLDTSGAIFSASGSQISADQVRIGGVVESAQNLLLSGSRIDLSGPGKLRAVGGLSIAGNALDLAGSGEAGDAISIGSTGTLSASGTLFGNSTLSLAATGNAVLTGSVSAIGGIDVSAATLSADGAIRSNGNVSLSALGGSLSVDGRVDGNGLSFRSSNGGLAIGARGAIYAASDLAIMGRSLSHAGSIAAIGPVRFDAAETISLTGRVASGGSVSLTAGTSLAAPGTIDARSIELSANSIDIGGQLRASSAVSIAGGSDLSIGGTIDAGGPISITGMGARFNVGLASTGRIASLSNVAIANAHDVALRGSLFSTGAASDVSIDSSGLASVSGSIDAGRDLVFTGRAGASSGIQVDGRIASGRSLGVASGFLDVRGQALAGNDLTVSLSSRNAASGLSLDLGGMLVAGRNVSIDAANGISVQSGATLSTGNALSLSAGSIVNDGQISAGGPLNLIARPAAVSGTANTGALLNNGLIQSTGPVSLTATNAFLNGATGRIVSDTSISISGASIQAGGRINAGDLATLTGSSVIVEGLLQSGRRIAIDAVTVDISASGRIEALGGPQAIALAENQFATANLAIRSSGSLSSSGALYSAGSLALESTSGSIDLAPGAGVSAVGAAILQASLGDVRLAPGIGSLSAASLGIFQGHDFVNGTNLTLSGDLLISAANITNNSALLGANGSLILRATGSLTNNGGTIFSGSALTLGAGTSLVNNSGNILALGNVTIAAPMIDNASGRIESLGGDIGIATSQLTNRIRRLTVASNPGGAPGSEIVVENSGASQIVAARDLMIDAPGGFVTNSNSSILAGSNLSIRTGTLNNLATLVQTVSEEPVFEQNLVHRIAVGTVPCPASAIPGTCKVIKLGDIGGGAVPFYTIWDEFEEGQIGTELVATQQALPTLIQAGGTLTIEASQVNNGTIASGIFLPTGSQIPGVTGGTAMALGGLTTAVSPGATGSPNTAAFSPSGTPGNQGALTGLALNASSSFGQLVARQSAATLGAEAAAPSFAGGLQTGVTAASAGQVAQQLIGERDATGAIIGQQVVAGGGATRVPAITDAVGISISAIPAMSSIEGRLSTTPSASSLVSASGASAVSGSIGGVAGLSPDGASSIGDVASAARNFAVDVAGSPLSAGSGLAGARNGEAQGARFVGTAVPNFAASNGRAGSFVFDFLRSFNLVASGGAFALGNNGGLFTFNNSPDADFLFTTKANLGDTGSLFDSDYFFDRLSIDRETHFTRLGDGFFEAQLISQQVRAATQAAQLAQFGTPLEQAAGLMQAALENKKRLDLSLGVALTESQVASLTSSIVWWVSMNVSGREVLVPVLYLAASDRKAIADGAILGGDKVALRTSGDIVNGGTIKASSLVTLDAGGSILNARGASIAGGDVVVRAATDIVNHAATISGKDVALLAGRDIRIDSVQSITSSSAYTELGKGRFTSSIQSATTSTGGLLDARGNLVLSAGRDLMISASAVKSNGNAALSAGRDIALTGVDETKSTSETWKTGKKQFGTSSATETRFVGSVVSAGGNLSLEAGNALSIKGSDLFSKGSVALSAVAGVTIGAAEERSSAALDQRAGKKTVISSEQTLTHGFSSIDAGGNIGVTSPGAIKIEGANLAAGAQAAIAGGSVSITGVIDSASSDSVTRVKKSGLASKKVTTTTVSSDQQRVDATTVAGRTVSIASPTNLNIAGSNIVATDDIRLAGGGAIDLGTLAATSHEEATTKVKKSGISIGGGGLFAGIAKATNSTTLDTVVNTGTVVASAKGNLSIAAAGALMVTGSKVAGPGEVSLSGDSVTIRNATDMADSTSLSKTSSFGLSIKLYENVSGATKVLTSLPDRVGEAKDGAGTTITAVSETLRTVSAVTNALTNTAGVSVNLGFSKSKTAGASQEMSAIGSTINGGDVTIRAASDLKVVGSAIKAADDITLSAGRDATFEAAQNTLATQSKSSSSGAGVGVSVGVGIVGGVNASASISAFGSKSSGQSREITHSNTQVSAAGVLAIATGRDATLQGALVEGRDVVVSVGRDLAVESVQDTSERSSIGAGFSAGLSLSANGVGANGSVSANKGNGSSAIVMEQTALFSRGGSLTASVTGNTDLKGGVIAALKPAGGDSGKLALSTGALSASDIRDSARNRDVSIGVSANLKDPFEAGVKGANTPVLDGSYASSLFRQETRATVGQGQLVVAAPDASATVNRDLGQVQVVTKDKQSGFTIYVDEAAIRETVALLKGDKSGSKILQGVDVLTKDPLGPARAVAAEINSLADSHPNSGVLDALLGKVNRLLVGDQRANEGEARTIANDPRFRGKNADETGAILAADAVAAVRARYGEEAANTYEALLQTPEGQAQLRAVGLITLAYRERGGDLAAIKDGLIPAALRFEGPSGAVGPGDLAIEGRTPTFGDKTVSVLAGAGKLINKVPPEAQEAASFGTSLLLGGPAAAVGGYFIGKAVEQGVKNSPNAQAAIKEAGLLGVDLLSSSSPTRNREEAEANGYEESQNLLVAAGTLLNIGTLKKFVGKATEFVGGIGKPTSSVGADLAESALATRPVPRQSEIDAATKLGPDFAEQLSFKGGQPVKPGTPGSVRPDLFCSASCISVEVKNYNLSRPGGISDLTSNAAKQVIKRATELPPGSVQQVLIDVRGQVLTPALQGRIKEDIVRKSNGIIKMENVRLWGE